MDLWVREARIFKYGSGVGTNFQRSRRNRKTAGGGYSSGLMSFLKMATVQQEPSNRAVLPAGQPKWFCLDLDHPEIEGFVNWK